MIMKHRIPTAIGLMFIVLGLFFSGCEKKIETTETNWVQDTCNSITDTRKIGQLLCLTVDPFSYFLFQDYKQNINHLIRKYQPGAIFFSSNLDSITAETRNEFNGNKLYNEVVEMQAFSKVPLLIAADFVNGAWYWDRNATSFPFPLALGASRLPEMAYRQGKITAVEAKAQGINWLFAPVLNTDIDSKNILQQMQSLGNDPELAGLFGAQFIKGCQEVSIAACMKYFPGSIKTLSQNISLDEKEPNKIKPFQAGIDAGVLSVMSPSPITRSSDIDSTIILSKVNIDNVLRKKLGFKGLIVTEFNLENFDPVRRFTMEGGNAQSELKIFMKTLQAGYDMYILPELFGGNIPFVDLILEKIQDGNVDTSPFDQSVKRIIELKGILNLQTVKYKSILRSTAGIGLPEYRQTSRDIANAAVTMLKNEDGIIPVRRFTEEGRPVNQGRYIVSITFMDEISPLFASLYGAKIDSISDSIKKINIFGTPDIRIQQEIIRRSNEADIVICSFFLETTDTMNDNLSDVSLWKAGKPSPEIIALIRKIAEVNNQLIIISFYNPYLINYFNEAKGYLATYSTSDYSMDAVVEVLLGKRNTNGRLPIRISEKYPMGFGLDVSGNNNAD